MDEASVAPHLDRIVACGERAYAPYSNFKVGCGIVTEDGQLYLGCNVENASYGLTLCAESGAISSMLADGGKCIDAVVIVSHADKPCTPCGACRQRLWEHGTAQTKVFLYTANSTSQAHQVYNLAELLPQPFVFDGEQAQES